MSAGTDLAARKYVEAIRRTTAGQRGGADALLRALDAYPKTSDTVNSLRRELKRTEANLNDAQIKKLQQRIDNAQDELDLAQREIEKLQ